MRGGGEIEERGRERDVHGGVDGGMGTCAVMERAWRGRARWRREREEGGQWQQPWGREAGSGVDAVEGTCAVVSRAWGGRAQRRREGGGDVQVRRGRAQQW